MSTKNFSGQGFPYDPPQPRNIGLGSSGYPDPNNGLSISRKNLATYDVDCSIARSNEIIALAGTCLDVLLDPAKFALGIPSGTYLYFNDAAPANTTFGGVPLPASVYDSAGNLICYPPYFIGGINFQRLYLTNPAVAGYGFTLVVATESIIDTIRRV